MAQSKKQPTGPKPRQSRLWLLVLLGAIGAAGGVFLLLHVTESKHGEDELKRIEGRWQRTDGGYSFEIKEAATDGQVQVRYFNPSRPSPIPVARAKVEQGGQGIQLFVELSGPGYEGSTYTLTYDAQADQLKGFYFQGPTGKEYAVVFRRAETSGPASSGAARAMR